MTSIQRPRTTFDSSKLNEPTMAVIRQGFLRVHGREMNDVDIQTLILTDAKTYLAAGKTASTIPASPARKPSMKKRLLAGSTAAIVGLMFLAPSAPSETKVITPAANSESVVSENPVDPITNQETDPVAPQQVQAAQTTSPPASTPAPKPTPVVVPAPAPAPKPPATDCDPNYAGGCVPNVSYDLDCPDIGFAVQVVGNDRHRFDRDKDGIGCE